MSQSDRPQPVERTPAQASTPAEGTRHEGFTLTDAEREALEVAVEYVGSAYAVEHHATTLRGLLERTQKVTP